jgi:hypothetical protein
METPIDRILPLFFSRLVFYAPQTKISFEERTLSPEKPGTVHSKFSFWLGCGGALGGADGA